MLVLLGIPVLVIGFVVGLNPLLVVAIAGFATGLLAGLDPLTILSAFGKAFYPESLCRHRLACRPRDRAS